MKNDKELIAVFDGWAIDNSFPDKETVYRKNGLLELKTTFKYDTSWDWLMPVVEKIHKIQPQAFRYSLEDGPLSPLAKLQIYDRIDEVYKAAVEFIKWYKGI